MFNYLKSAGLALLVVATRSLAADIPTEDGVLVLDPSNFADAVAQNPTLLVEFYAPWCGHCKKLAPEYAKAAEALAKEDLKIAKVDCDEHKDLAKEYGVSGFPTLKLLKEGKPSDYGGGRTADDIIKYVIKKSGPAAKTLTTKAEATAFEGEAEAVVLGLFSSADSPEAKAFMSVANGIDRLPFATSSTKEVLKAYGAGKGGKVVVMKTYDEKKAVLDVSSSTTEEEIADWVEGASMRLVTTFSPETSSAIFGGKIKVHMLYMADASSSTFEAESAALTKVASANRGKLLHVHVPHTEDRVLQYFGAKADNLPMVVIADMSSTSAIKKYTYSDKISEAGLLAFEKQFLGGELVPTLKSEEPADEDLAEPVKVLKGKSFSKLVLENDKDVMVEFYAPWCGHCKALAPKYDELASKLEGVDSVVVAKMDATENEIDVDGVEVAGFPTLFFFPGNAKDSPVKYEGPRETEDLAKYIMDNASTSFKLEGVESEDVKDEL
ncbi:unnamed protein product [Ectocarpus fasciculatus]